MRKSRIKSHFFGFRRWDYEDLLKLGLDNTAINILRHNPTKFFLEFNRYTQCVANEHKAKLFKLCFKMIADKDRAKIESIIFKQEEVKVA